MALVEAYCAAAPFNRCNTAGAYRTLRGCPQTRKERGPPSTTPFCASTPRGTIRPRTFCATPFFGSRVALFSVGMGKAFRQPPDAEATLGNPSAAPNKLLFIATIYVIAATSRARVCPLSPLLRAVPKMRRRCLRRDAKCTPSFTWQRSAPGRRARGGLEIQEARCDRCRRSASNGRGVRRPPKGTWPARRSQERAPAAACSGAQNRRHAGAARRPRGPLQGPRGPPRGPQAGPAGSAGAGGQPAPGSPRGARVPVAPRGATPWRRRRRVPQQSTTKRIDIRTARP